MVLLLLNESFILTPLYLYLHSNMVLLLQEGFVSTAYQDIKIYIPIWCYYYADSLIEREHTKRIYIPIWCYYYCRFIILN